jgi:hypothetical protein
MFGCRLLKTYLYGFISVARNRLDLGYDAGADFYDGDRNYCTVLPEHLGHADLPAQQRI